MASILETFYILFKSDADEVDKGAKKADESIDKLEKSIAGADKASISLGKKFNNVATQAVAAFAAAYSISKLMSGAQGIATESKQLGVLSQVLGESASEIVSWGRAVESVGGDSEAFEGSIHSLSSSLNDVLVNGANAASLALAKIGVSARDQNDDLKTVLQILPEIAKQFETIPREAALSRGRALGLDEATLLLLMRGERGVRILVQRQREMNLVTDRQRRALSELGIRWIEFTNFLDDVASTLLLRVMPYMEQAGRAMSAFFVAITSNEDTALAFFIGLGAALAFMAIQILILAAPFLVFVATMAAIVAIAGGLAFAINKVVTDLQAFAEGNESVLGDAVKRWKFVSDAVEFFQRNLKVVMMLFREFKKLIAQIELPEWMTSLEGLGEGILGLLDKGDALYRDLTEGDVSIGKKLLLSTLGVPLSAINAQSAANAAGGARSSTITIGEVTVETLATDAAGVAEGLASEIGRQTQQAVDGFDDGIAG